VANLTFIDLLRHGETLAGPRFCGSTDVALSERGWTQMWTAVQGAPRWDHIISSPLVRCAAFARLLSQRLALPCAFDERIREMHFGTWEGRTAAELMKKDPDALTRFWTNPARYTPPAAEPVIEFARRALSAWRDILANYAGRRILLITHAGVLRTIFCDLHQRPVKRLLEFDVPYGAMQRLSIGHGGTGLHYTSAGNNS
jgi:alpha-ribazole phosphatase